MSSGCPGSTTPALGKEVLGVAAGTGPAEQQEGAAPASLLWGRMGPRSSTTMPGLWGRMALRRQDLVEGSGQWAMLSRAVKLLWKVHQIN